MKILVFSDAHGEIRGMEKAIHTHEMDTDAILYLGDGTAAAEILLGQFPNIMHMAVLGNNDFGHAGVWECVLELDGVRIFCTHGHKYGVKSGMERLCQAAIQKKADLVLFGHTHLCADFTMEGIRFLNPGSVGRGRQRTYGVIYLNGGNIVSGFGKVSH
ncbi:MAG: YfcE family phosphodiesterase [Clostridiales bacterium]|nr:YfcE family phosphodiesterase [Clostridiales bacterium]